MADEIVKVLKRGVGIGDNFAAANAKFAEHDAAIAGLEQDFAGLPESFDYLPLAGGDMNVGAMISFAEQGSTKYTSAHISGTGMTISHQPANSSDTGIGTTILDQYISVQYHNGLSPMELEMSPTQLSFKQYGSATNLCSSIGVPDTIVSGATYTIYLPNNSGTVALLSDVESALAEAGKIDAITVGGKSVPIENKTAKINVSSDITVTENTTNKTLTLSVPELANKATSLELSVDTSTYVLTAKLKKADGTALSTQTVDLPLETMVVGADYDEATKEIVLTLQNGTTTKFSVADLVEGLVSTSTLNSTLANYLPLSGGKITGDLAINSLNVSVTDFSTSSSGTVTLPEGSTFHFICGGTETIPGSIDMEGGDGSIIKVNFYDIDLNGDVTISRTTSTEEPGSLYFKDFGHADGFAISPNYEASQLFIGGSTGGENLILIDAYGGADESKDARYCSIELIGSDGDIFLNAGDSVLVKNQLVVNGNIWAYDGINLKTINAPTTMNGSTFGAGSVGQVLTSSGTGVYWSDVNKNAFGEYTAAVSATTVQSDGTYTQTFTSTTQKLRPLFVLNSSNKMVDVDWEMITNGWKLISDISLTGTAYFASMTI